MRGREPQMFITSSRTEAAEKLKIRMKNGLGSSRYKPPDFDRLQADVDANRRECDLLGHKVQKTRHAAKATKESSILRQHRQVWSRECPRLQKAEEKAEIDMQDFLEQIKPSRITDTAIFSLQEFELVLERIRESFRMATVEPIYQLREDLCFRLSEVKQQQLSTLPSNWDEVTQQIKFVKDQQDAVISSLHVEYLNLEQEINSLGLENYLNTTPDNLVNTNVPEEVLDSDCPYPELKDLLIQAFRSLSEKYKSRLQSVKEQLQRSDRFCGWCPDDHEFFLFTLSRYTYELNQRELCRDMLSRLFPEKTIQELREHERLWDSQRFTQAQLRVVTQQWQRDQEELWVRALVTLQEAKHAHQAELELHRDRQHQQEICSNIKKKLQHWRAQQEEVAKLEAAIAERQQKEEEATAKSEQEKETNIRSHQKEKVRQFHLKQRRKREMLERRDQERLANLRSVMEEQARRDKQRVQFRADKLQERRMEQKAQELERQREEQERQKRLQALRDQVAVVAEADPERMMADTEAWKCRNVNENDFDLQRPFYNINTYTDVQIVSDPRVRVEQALREAGMHQSQYAKEVLSVVQPPKPPRRDTKSIFEF